MARDVEAGRIRFALTTPNEGATSAVKTASKRALTESSAGASGAAPKKPKRPTTNPLRPPRD